MAGNDLPRRSSAAMRRSEKPGKEMVPESRQGRHLIRYEQTPSVAVPSEVLDRQRMAVATGRGELRDHFGVLRSRVLSLMAAKGWRTLGITSARRGEGKTWTAVNLAVSAARRVGHTCLLVDTNLRRPAVHRHFGISGEHGLSSFLCDGVPLELVMLHPDVGNLTVVPAGVPLRDSSDFFGSQLMEGLVQEAAHRYDNRVVIFDLPAIDDGDGALAMLPHLDAVLLVVEVGATSRMALARAADALVDVPVIGTVLNKSREAA